MNTQPIKNIIRAPYAFPGGYPKYLLMDDGEALCHKCAKSEYKQLLSSTRGQMRDGWQVICEDINWEQELYCAHCNAAIESAYEVQL